MVAKGGVTEDKSGIEPCLRPPCPVICAKSPAFRVHGFQLKTGLRVQRLEFTECSAYPRGFGSQPRIHACTRVCARASARMQACAHAHMPHLRAHASPRALMREAVADASTSLATTFW